MNENAASEFLATGLSKIRLEIKTRLASHGLYGTINTDFDPASSSQHGLNVEVAVKGKVASRLFERQLIEGCHLRVHGAVLADIVSMIEELAATGP